MRKLNKPEVAGTPHPWQPIKKKKKVSYDK
jgi:hypothetical protein